MGAFEHESDEELDLIDDTDAEADEFVSKAENGIQMAATKVAGWMKKMAKGPGAPAEEIALIAPMLAKMGSGETPSKKGKQMPDEEDEYPSPVSGKKKAKAEDEESACKGDCANCTGVSKAFDEGASAIVMEDGTVFIGTPVSKARKFTSARTATISQAVMALGKLLNEVNPDEAKKAMSSVLSLAQGSQEEAAGNPEQESDFESAVRPEGTSKGKPWEDAEAEKADDSEEADAEKADDMEAEEEETEDEAEVKGKKKGKKLPTKDEEADAMKAKEIENLKKRLDEIDRVRTPSKAVTDEGGTDTKVAKGAKKSMWSGVL